MLLLNRKYLIEDLLLQIFFYLAGWRKVAWIYESLFSLDQSIVILHQTSGLMFMSDTFLLFESKKEHLSS